LYFQKGDLETSRFLVEPVFLEAISKVEGIQRLVEPQPSVWVHDPLAGIEVSPSSPKLLHPAFGGAKKTFEMTSRNYFQS
jgi:hypothetical protein